MFLPNWQSIAGVFDELALQHPELVAQMLLFVLHSSLPISEQQEVFEHAPAGGPLVAVATNTQV